MALTMAAGMRSTLRTSAPDAATLPARRAAHASSSATIAADVPRVDQLGERIDVLLAGDTDRGELDVLESVLLEVVFDFDRGDPALVVLVDDHEVEQANGPRGDQLVECIDHSRRSG